MHAKITNGRPEKKFPAENSYSWFCIWFMAEWFREPEL